MAHTGKKMTYKSGSSMGKKPYRAGMSKKSYGAKKTVGKLSRAGSRTVPRGVARKPGAAPKRAAARPKTRGGKMRGYSR